MVFRYLFFLTIWNLVVFLFFGYDKRKAKKGERRISEASLLTMSFMLGGLGAFLGMYHYRHKTMKLKFKVCVPIAAAITMFVYVAILRAM